MDVPSLMRQAVQLYGDRTAIITEDRTLTFAQAIGQPDAAFPRPRKGHRPVRRYDRHPRGVKSG